MNYKNIGPWKFDELKEKADYIVLDVRTPRECLEIAISGHIAINIYDPSFEAQVEKLDKSKAYLIYCRTGLRSRQACEMMSRIGFERLYNLEGGIVSYSV
ncbi:MAG: rhodanese-like domain-containing protein [Cyclobacteriaceae bacterium]